MKFFSKISLILRSIDKKVIRYVLNEPNEPNFWCFNTHIAAELIAERETVQRERSESFVKISTLEKELLATLAESSDKGKAHSLKTHIDEYSVQF